MPLGEKSIQLGDHHNGQQRHPNHRRGNWHKGFKRGVAGKVTGARTAGKARTNRPRTGGDARNAQTK